MSNKDNPKLLEKINEILGDDQDPFEIPIGPTKDCLSSNQVVAYVRDKRREPKIVKHLSECSVCSERIIIFGKLIKSTD